MPETQGFHLSAALDGAGSHPAAPARPFTPEEYARLVRRAEAGLLDFITVEDGPGRRRATPSVPGWHGSSALPRATGSWPNSSRRRTSS
ncbi:MULTISPECIES: hypothetical protein [Streptomyces]|uniref:hypothetical protein n=1 Tax=Streptomyces TaxID=1883 RepID=UPI00352D7173